jgi:hypothetical protein
VNERRVVALLALGAVLVCMGLSARAERAGAAGASALQVQEASALSRFTLPQDVVAADDQYVAGLADRSVPPALVDTSQVRIQSGYLTTRRVEDILTRSDARAVLFGSGRFDMLPGFRAWVEANYTKIADFPKGGALYLKVPQGPQIT